MFKIGDYAVCPGHGVGQICDIEERAFGDETKYFYIIKILANGMTVMVPTDTENGIRKLVEQTDLDSMFELLNDHDVELDYSTWNRRYRDYMNKVKTGSIIEIASVLRELFLLKEEKNLSFGEKKMLDQCRDLVVHEISIFSGEEQSSISKNIDNCFPEK